MSQESSTEHAAARPDVPRPSDGSQRGNAPWWRHLSVIVALAALPRIGLYFAGLVAMLLLFTDQRRHPYSRLGGTLVIAWWTFTWARAGVPPFVGVGMLGAAAACFVTAAVQSKRSVARLRNGAFAAVVAALALLNVVPFGVRTAKFDEAGALALVLQSTPRVVKPTQAQITLTRERFVQRRLYVVQLFEPNTQTKATADGEPCFRRSEVHVVDALDGSVDRTDLIDRLMLVPGRYSVAQARERDGFCLPLPRGTSRDIVPISSA